MALGLRVLRGGSTQALRRLRSSLVNCHPAPRVPPSSLLDNPTIWQILFSVNRAAENQ